MDRKDLLKKILELSLELKDAEGVQAMMCITDMENAVKDYEKELRLYRVSNSSDLYVVELSDEEIKIIDQKELDEWYKSAEEFDGFLGFTIRGKLMK